jgi:AcrR family transcriptional regulator
MGRTPVQKQRINNEKKQSEIVKSLAPHYLSKGIKSISTEEMCEITGKSKATLYKYFDSRKEMVQHILLAKIDSLTSLHAALINIDLDYISRYQQAVRIATETVADLSNTFLSDLADLFPDLYQQIIDVKRLTINLLKDFYRAGIEDGAFVAANPDVLALMDELFFDAIVNPKFLSARNLQLNTLFDDYFKIRFHGIVRN